MPQFQCEKCLKIFNHKGHFENHNKRKFSCLAVDDYHKNGKVLPRGIPRAGDGNVLNIDPPQIARKGGVDINQCNPQFSVTKKSDKNKITIKPQNTNKECSIYSNYDITINEKQKNKPISDITISCHYCYKEFKNRSSLVRHGRNCPMRPLTKADIGIIENKIEKNTVSTLPSSNSGFTQNINNNTINNNTINNTQNIYYLDNLITNKLLPFGKEDIEYLTNDLMKNIISQPELGIIKLMQQVHFNDEQPQNKNIFMTNKKDPYLEVFNGEKWEKQDKKIAIQNMITTKKDIMDDYFDEQVEKNIISTFIKKNYETFSDMLDNYVRESLTDYDDNIKSRVVRKCLRLYREICKQAELLLVNNKNKPKEICKKDVNPAIKETETDSEEDV